MVGDSWPRHEGGEPKSIGEMTPAERRAVTEAAVRKFEAELRAKAPALARALGLEEEGTR